MFLKKRKGPNLEAREISADVPEDSVMYDQQVVDPKKVRPILMGEFLRKYVSRRLLALGEGEIAAIATAIRQLGVGSQGGVEALAIFHQLINDERASGSPNEPPARIKVDGKNCFGMIEWKAVREVALRFLPKHTAAAGWKHRNLSHVEQEGVLPMPENRGAGQGDVDGLLECSSALGMVAAETRGRVAAQQEGAFCGLVLMTPQKHSACKQNTQPICR